MRALRRRRRGDVLPSGTPFGEVRPREAGGKGWHLLRLDRLGYPVPPFFIISTRAFVKALRPARKRIESLVRSADFMDRDSLENVSLAIREMILGTEIPPETRRELESALDRLPPGGMTVAVRSSVVGEDSGEHSFAGLMDSFLEVARADVTDAVRKVWASAFSARALRYRKEKGLSLRGIAAAVIVQEMVDASASGVVFTRDPETREPECVVSAGFGPGEGVAQDRVETDTYRVSPDAEPRMSRSVRCGQVLKDAEIRRLCGLGLRIENDFGCPQDIEWARDAGGRISILQTRPIVFARTSAPDDSFRVWDNSNIVESYPGLTLPLTFSFVRECYEIVFRAAARGLDLSGRGLAAREDLFPCMIGLLGGRVYYNLLNWYEILSYLPGFDKHKASWDRMIGISRRAPFPGKKGSARQRFAAFAVILKKLLSVRRTIDVFFNHFRKVYGRFGERDFSGASTAELMRAYDELKRTFAGKWALTLHNDFCAMTYYEALRRLCLRRGFEDHPNLHNDLLCGEKGVESAAPVRHLVRLGELVRGRPRFRRLVCGKDSAAAWQEIRMNPAFEELRTGFDDYLGRYGDRGVEELKLETPTYREEPASLVDLVRNYCEMGLTVEALETKEREVRKLAEDIVRSRLRNPLWKIAFGFVLKNARRAVAGRENMRFARTRLFGVVRQITRRAGALFAEEGLIERPSDVSYLTVDEVFGAASGAASVQNLKALVSLRKSEYEAFAKLELEDRFVTRGIPRIGVRAPDAVRKDAPKRLRGINCSAGHAEGAARIVLDPRSAGTDGRFIIIAESTDPGWVFLMLASKGIIVERGSVLSHTAIIGRELGIPTIVGAKDATKLIPDGARLFMDGSTGEIRWQ
jgi:phosphohistidine swiveling domain-containing protein